MDVCFDADDAVLVVDGAAAVALLATLAVEEEAVEATIAGVVFDEDAFRVAAEARVEVFEVLADADRVAEVDSAAEEAERLDDVEGAFAAVLAVGLSEAGRDLPVAVESIVTAVDVVALDVDEAVPLAVLREAAGAVALVRAACLAATPVADAPRVPLTAGMVATLPGIAMLRR